VRAHEANSHAGKGWERFTQKVIEAVGRERKEGVVFLAWGSPAQKRVVGVNGSRHLILKSVHPSPLSASRGFVSFQSAGIGVMSEESTDERHSLIADTSRRRMSG